MKTSDEVLSVIDAWRDQRAAPGLPVDGLMAWQILGQLDGVAVDGPLEATVLNGLMTRADREVVPVLRQLARERVIRLEGRAVF